MIDPVVCVRWVTQEMTARATSSASIARFRGVDIAALAIISSVRPGTKPVWTMPGVASRFDGVDLVVVRENTEDLYAGLEHEVVPGVVESLKIITERASTRIARFAFEFARRNGRKKVTAISTNAAPQRLQCVAPG